MGSRRDNRSSLGGGPTVVALHSKHHHEKRNHELVLKRLASSESHSTTTSTTAVKPSNPKAGMSVMSKSLTLELGKSQDSANKNRTRKKSDVEKSLKSVQRQTSKSSSRMSSSLSEKELLLGDNKLNRIRDSSPAKRKGQVPNNLAGKTAGRKRDPMTGKPSSQSPAGSSVDKKGVPGAGENIKRADVFERLSRQDCNKGVTRSEHGHGNRIRDRSPAKTGRKSPQEKNVSDKHQKNRKSTAPPGDTSTKNGHLKKRDPSPIKREDSGRRKFSSQDSLERRKVSRQRIRGGSDHDLDEDKDSSREKLEKDNVPESPDKDLEDSAARDDVDKKLAEAAPGDTIILPGKVISIPSRQGEVGGGDDCGVGGRGGEKVGLEAKGKVKLGRNITTPPTSKGIASEKNILTSSEAHDLLKTTTTSESSNAKKVLSGAVNGTSHITQNLPKAPITSTKPQVGGDTVPAVLSKADVMQKVRQRVPNDYKRDVDVVDDDKDVCEAEKCDEDEFYRIKVQTRLVSYSNSTLVIKNTSKCAAVGDDAGAGGGGEQARDNMESDSSHPHHPSPPPSPPTAVASQSRTLQTSSVPLKAVVPLTKKVDPDGGGAPAIPAEAQQLKRRQTLEEEEKEENDEEEEEATVPLLTRSRSMRLKLSQFVCKGKSFLSDVYSATQSKLEQYTRVDAPTSATRGPEETTLNVAFPSGSDSGYYSISASLDGMRSPSTEDLPGASCPREDHTCVGDNGVDREYPKNASSTDGRIDTPDGSIKTQGSVVEEEEEEVLPSPPSPHVNFTLNEEWIKKNILCTCKCKRDSAKVASEQSSASQSSDEKVADDSSVSSSDNTDVVDVGTTICRESGSVSIGNGEEERLDSTTSSEEAPTTKDLDELCLCSCHEGEENQQLHQLPQEVQDILDADHARMWWTITGNFGNILPIDWSKSYTRQQYLPVLNLNEAKAMTSPSDESERTAEDDAEEEEEVAQDLDLHHLILNGLSAEPVKSAEEVIKEIDDLMQEGSSSEDEGVEEASSSGVNANEPLTQPLPPPLYAEKLNNMSIGELNEAFMELELVIRQYSETLINQLALRDELEYEKELKNSFISLLLQVQNKRRNFNVEKKKQKKVGPNGIDPKYLTTVIPYDVGHGPPTNETLQILIKILMAINEDSPTVPTLLTDYILKVLCPS